MADKKTPVPDTDRTEDNEPKGASSDKEGQAPSVKEGQAPSDKEGESGDQGNQEEGAGGGVGDWLSKLLQQSLGIGAEKPEQLLKTVDFEGIADFIKTKKDCKIITMAGAGISTSAGIPDFRSPGSGLYDNLQKYNLPDPQAIFSIDFFKESPEPFFELARELFPGQFKPTPCHYFIKMLDDKGLLLRHYTQNIDTLERVSGLNGDKIVEAHGTFHTSHCLACGKEYCLDWMKNEVFKGGVPKCDVEGCEGVVKPDIVFFGEALPKRFFDCVKKDMMECDLLIIMGTSLVVQPFASLTSRVPDTTPRLYINREKSPPMDPFMALLMGGGSDFNADKEGNYRDVFWEGSCDDGAQALATLLGWGEELKTTVKTEQARIDKETKDSSPAKKS